jgi:MMPL family
MLGLAVGIDYALFLVSRFRASNFFSVRRDVALTAAQSVLPGQRRISGASDEHPVIREPEITRTGIRWVKSVLSW